MRIRQPLIAAPSYDVLSSDWHQVVPEGRNPVNYTQRRIVEPIPFNEVYRKPRQSEFNTKPSFLDQVFSLWWPDESPWQQVHWPLFKTEQPQPLAAMPKGRQTVIGLRSNIRQPSPAGQGELVSAAADIGQVQERGTNA